MGNPDIHNGIFEPWNSSLVSLARHPNVHIKVSGALEEAAAGEYGNWFVVANVSLCYFLVLSPLLSDVVRRDTYHCFSVTKGPLLKSAHLSAL